MAEQKWVIEVGANRGTDTVRLADAYPDCNIISFEPVPHLFNKLQAQFADHPRVGIINAAVSDVAGRQKFYITKTDPKIQAIYGASSLYEFHPDLKSKWDRPDFCTEMVFDVNVTVLSNLIWLYGIREIEYLHCDAQGADLQVLQGLGEYSDIVKAGVVEATRNIPLYANCNNTESAVINWLETHGYTVHSVVANDKLDAEVNIHFKRNW